MNATYEEYKTLIKKMLTNPANVYVASSVEAFGDLAEEIEAIEEAHPEYEDALVAEGV